MLSSFCSPLNSTPDIPGIISVVTAGIISVVGIISVAGIISMVGITSVAVQAVTVVVTYATFSCDFRTIKRTHNCKEAGARFSKVPITFRARNQIFKSK